MTDTSIQTKQCTKCKEIFPCTGEFFGADSKTKNGFRNRCRTCNNKDARDYFASHRDIASEKHKQYYKANNSQILGQKKLYHKNNRETILTKKKHYYRKNKNYILDKCRDYYQCNAEYVKSRARAYYHINKERSRNTRNMWRLNHPDNIRKSSARYRSAHKEQRRFYSQQRRARKKELWASLTKSEWELILVAYNHCCAYCNRSEQEIGHKLHQEHVVPLVQGGGYIKENIVPACQSCNSKKGGRTPEQAGMILNRPDVVY